MAEREKQESQRGAAQGRLRGAALAPLIVMALLVWAPSALAADSITEFSAGMNPSSDPKGIVVGQDGNLWFTDGHEAIGRITPSGTIIEFSSGLNPESDPAEIITGPDGNLWFTDDPWETGTPAIGRITPSGTITEFNTGLNQSAEPVEVAEPTSIVAGPDGNAWFTDSTFFYEGRKSAIGRITPSGTLTEFEMPEAINLPLKIIAGSDGNLWFTDPTRAFFNGKIGRITPSGTITEFSTSATGAPRDLVVGPDGNIWFTAKDAIGRIMPGGTITAFSAGLSAEPNLGRIVDGPDGNLWFTEYGESESTRGIGRITPSGTITMFPTTDPERRPPLNLVAGPDGNLWFTYDENPQISRITPSGQVTNFSFGLPSDASPGSLAVGPGGANLWFTATTVDNGGAIGRIAPVGPAGVTPNPQLRVISEGNGTVSSSPAGINCGASCSEAFPSGTVVTLTATPAAGFTFKGWDAGENCANPETCNWLLWQEGSSCSGIAPCQLPLNGDAEVAAVFVPNESSGGGAGGGTDGGGSGTGTNTPPNTVLGSHPPAKLTTKAAKAKVKFKFSSNTPGATFKCKLDKGTFTPCTSPKTYKVKPGKHVFTVEAVDAAGADATPATYRFKVVRRR